MVMIQLVRYSTTRGALKQIQQYQLVNVMYTATPQQVIRACKSDLERTAVMIMNGNQLVGFFCLHVGQGPLSYGETEVNTILLRALSVDDRFMHQRVASDALAELPRYLASHYPMIQTILLAVNHANHVAQHLYLTHGFTDTHHRIDGRLGRQFIYERPVHCPMDLNFD